MSDNAPAPRPTAGGVTAFLPLSAPLIVTMDGGPLVLLAFGIDHGLLVGFVVGMNGGAMIEVDPLNLDFPPPVQSRPMPVDRANPPKLKLRKG